MRRLIHAAVVALLATSCTAGAAETTVTSTPSSTTAATTITTTSTTTTTVAPTTTTTTTTTVPPTPYGVPGEPAATQAAPSSGLADGFGGVGLVTIAAGGAPLYEDRALESFVVAREGLVFPAQRMNGEWIEVFTSCDAPAWVKSADVAAESPAEAADIGEGFELSAATIVLDPGHGGPWNTGAASPSGMAEKTANLDVAQRVRDLLNEARSVDWVTGEILNGEDIPAADRVILTRVGDGEDGDYEAGLFFRSLLANAANAHAMVAIHHNAGWEVSLDRPGSDVYYQSQIVESRRFAKIMVEELHRGFGPFEADWVGAAEAGAKSRLSPREGNPQYYGILRYSEMPTVIAEGAYISNQSEADLIATPEFRQAYAGAIYRALVRFLTTDDVGDGLDSDPVIWTGDAGSGDARPECEIPSQGDR